MPTERQQLEATIAALEAQRPVLGDAVVAMAIAPLRDKLTALRARAQGEQQLKTVSILFMDVVGSTQLSQYLDPEDVHAVMDTALERLSALVRGQNGQVLKYAGDSLLAAFGAEQALEGDAERAVRAGLAILEEAPRLAAEVQAAYGLQGFNLRVGINTGRVLLGGGVDAESSIRGTPVNIAARMEQTAPPGGLRISHETYRHVRGVFDVEAQAPIEIKGITGPVRSYLVLRAKPRAFRVANRGLEGIESPMVGRDAELARIAETFQSVREKNSLALVTVVGEPGIGKSRLGFEFTHWLELLSERVRFFQGRPQPYGNNVPFGLLRDLIAWRFEILESDSQATVQAKLAQGFGQVLGERAAEYTALVGQLIGFDYAADPHIAAIASEGKQIRDRAFHALAEYFRLLHRQDGAPIVFLLDDLHWADDGSLDFVNHLAQAGRDLPILILGLTRAMLYERRPLWGSGQSNHQRIDLAPLTKRGTRELIETLLSRLETVPAALRDLLASSAEGNPYFVEELVGMLIDDGVIVTTEEPWRVVGDKLLEVNVPTTLTGVLQARIDSLPVPEKAALQQASVIGHVFWDEALRRISPTAGKALESLTLRELTYERETSAFEGTREFVFKHHMLHQVTYQSVLKRPRREQHRITADWLVERSGDRASEYFGLIADHYESAGDTANAVDLPAPAPARTRHGAMSMRPRSNTSAAPLRSCRPQDDAATRFSLLATRSGIYSHTGRRSEQAEDVALLEQVAEALDDDAFRARAAACALRSRSSSATIPAWWRRQRAPLPGPKARAHPAAALRARINWARALQFQGDYAAAQAHDRAIARLGARSRRPQRRGDDARAVGILATQRGRYGIARDYYRQALAVARSIGHRCARERHDQQPRRDRAAARQLRRCARAVPGGPAPVRRDRRALRRFLPAVQHGAQRVPARRRGRVDRLGDAGDAARR